MGTYFRASPLFDHLTDFITFIVLSVCMHTHVPQLACGGQETDGDTWGHITGSRLFFFISFKALSLIRVDIFTNLSEANGAAVVPSTSVVCLPLLAACVPTGGFGCLVCFC